VTDVVTGPGYELRQGRWQDVLADVGEVSALVTDPPYGARTHAGQRHGRRDEVCASGWVSARGIHYDGWTPEHVAEFCAAWSERVTGWFCAMTSHDLVPAYFAALESLGRYVFAPIPCVMPGMNVRLAGDGPSSWCVWLVVSRPRSMRHWGTLPGAYTGNPFDPGENTATAYRRRSVVGSKPAWLMRAIVRDYTRPGDIVCDPCAGGGTTLLAARMEGRRFVGAEVDPATHAKAMARLARYPVSTETQPALFDRLEAAQ
jgi:hypothetical protein